MPNWAVTFMNPVHWNTQSLGGMGAEKPGVRPPGSAPTRGACGGMPSCGTRR
jgi:hypothetical protein